MINEIAKRMAKEFMQAKKMEEYHGYMVEDYEAAGYYTNKKWDISEAAEVKGIRKEFEEELKNLKVY